jgi:hypothetical protein
MIKPKFDCFMKHSVSHRSRQMSKLCIFLANVAILCIVLAWAAQGQSEVKLSSLLPARGPIRTVVLLRGAGFTETSNMIHFGPGGKKDLMSSNGGTQIYYTIPGGVGPCDLIGPACMGAATRMVTPGQYPIYVTNGRGRSDTLMFEVTK